jgi:signal transduction histidine kinase
MIRNIMVSFETRIVDKKINMNVVFANGSSWVYADAQKIQRVIYNLLDNAVKFTPDGKSITIETTNLEDKISVSVTDTGIGMTEDEVKHIFERFYKADSSRGQDKKGTGLGLSIVKEIVKAHNETITVKSELGLGTTFTITLAASQEID